MEIVSMLRVKAWHLVTKEPPPNEVRDGAWLEKDIWARPLNMVSTRPDISFAVIRLSQYSRQPRTSHCTALKRVLRYFKIKRHSTSFPNYRKPSCGICRSYRPLMGIMQTLGLFVVIFSFCLVPLFPGLRESRELSL